MTNEVLQSCHPSTTHSLAADPAGHPGAGDIYALTYEAPWRKQLRALLNLVNLVRNEAVCIAVDGVRSFFVRRLDEAENLAC